MIKHDFDALQELTRCMTGDLNDLFDKLDEILSVSGKNFSIEFKGNKFEFHPATTKGEVKALSRRRKKFIKLLLKYAMTRVLKELHSDAIEDSWEPVLAFAQGMDPQDAKIDKEELDEIRSSIAEQDEEFGKARPLDEEAYQIKVQDQRKEYEFVE